MATPTWVIDTSSLIILRSLMSRDVLANVFKKLSALTNQGRLVFPREVVAELERYQGADNTALIWAKGHVGLATKGQPSFESVASVLAQVPDVLDSEEYRTTVDKLNLGSGAGLLRIPSVSIKAMLKFEGISLS